MKYRALISFSGLFSMAQGEVREISDQAVADGLAKVGYIEPVDEPAVKSAEEPKKAEPKKKTTKKK